MRPPLIVFLVDVDNTLLNNDEIERDLHTHLGEQLGVECQARYWELLEELRSELGYADYLGAVQRLRVERLHDPRLLKISSFMLDYPFADRLYPGSLELLSRLHSLGTTVILSDGDAVFQPWKVERSGLYSAADGNVLICVHKEQELAEIETQFAADHYVLVDDKLRILSAVKEGWQSRVTTVLPLQGHYTHDPNNVEYSPADITIGHIGDLLQQELLDTILAHTSAS